MSVSLFKKHMMVVEMIQMKIESVQESFGVTWKSFSSGYLTAKMFSVRTCLPFHFKSIVHRAIIYFTLRMLWSIYVDPAFFLLERAVFPTTSIVLPSGFLLFIWWGSYCREHKKRKENEYPFRM